MEMSQSNGSSRIAIRCDDQVGMERDDAFNIRVDVTDLRHGSGRRRVVAVDSVADDVAPQPQRE